MLETEERYRREDPKRLNYLSIEFLLGQSLGNHLHNLGIRELYRRALGNLGANLEAMEESEQDAALGNGGLGRLAACFLDSLATLGMPAYGYGINYEYGLFKQEIDNGDQREKPDNWLANGTPWEIARPDEACLVPVYGRIEHAVDRAGGYNPMWLDWKLLVGIPHDMLIPGYGGRTVNRLRLYCGTRLARLRHADLQRRRLLQGRRAEDLIRNDLQGALSFGRRRRGPGIAAHAGVLPRGLRRPRHRPQITSSITTRSAISPARSRFN